MFYQNVIKKENNELIPIVISENAEKMEPNTAYYIIDDIEADITIKGTNGEYSITADNKILYNPLKEAYFLDKEVNVYKIKNIITDKPISKIQIEFYENDNLDLLSKNSIFINMDEIHGYKIKDNIYSFEIIDDISTKIYYLGFITVNLKDNDYIILNYYTKD